MKPRRLKPGDVIGIVAPSKAAIDAGGKRLENAVLALKGYGLETRLGRTMSLIDRYGISGGSPQERADDINAMFKDPSVSAIWCFQGGDTAIEVLDLLDYDLIRKNPKVFMGASDAEMLGSAIHKKTGLFTFVFPDPKVDSEQEIHFGPAYTRKEFERVFLSGGYGAVPHDTAWSCVRPGRAKGGAAGCNVQTLLRAAGTEYFPDFDGKILFLEDYRTTVHEAVQRLTHLKHLGVFDRAKGAVVGHVWGFERQEQYDAQGKRVFFEDVLLDVTRDYSFPILKVSEFGHYCPSTAIPIGAPVEVDAEKKIVVFPEPYLA